MYCQCAESQPQSAVFLPEFALSPQGSFMEDATEDQFLTYRYDDQVSLILILLLDHFGFAVLFCKEECFGLKMSLVATVCSYVVSLPNFDNFYPWFG